MILDQLAHAGLYEPLHPGLAAAMDFLRSGRHDSLAPGRHPVDDDRLIAIVDVYNTSPAGPESVWEAHRRYADVQYLVEGVERHGRLPLSQAKLIKPYDAERDVTFYAPGKNFVTLHAGDIAIYFPHDVHAPGLAVTEPVHVRKIVMKVLLDRD